MSTPSVPSTWEFRVTRAFGNKGKPEATIWVPIDTIGEDFLLFVGQEQSDIKKSMTILTGGDAIGRFHILVLGVSREDLETKLINLKKILLSYIEWKMGDMWTFTQQEDPKPEVKFTS